MHLWLRILTWLVASCIATHAVADSDDLITLNLGADYNYHTNIFRLPNDRTSSPGAPRSDGIATANLGVVFNKKYSMQSLAFEFTHIESKYRNFSYLDYEANNYRGSWSFMLTPYLEGKLYADRNERPIGFIDNTNYSQQNIRITQNKFVDLDYSPLGNWHLLGGFSQISAKNTKVFNQQTPFEANVIKVGASYVFPSLTTFQFTTKFGDGQYGQALDASLQQDSGYKEQVYELTLDWPASLKSKFGMGLGYVNRKSDNFSTRDYGDFLGNLSYDWSVTPNVDLVVGFSRKIASFQQSTSSYTATDSAYINPVWKLTNKLSLNLSAEIGRRSFKGFDAFRTTDAREDDTQAFACRLSWTPNKNWVVGTELQRQTRTSNVAGLDYGDTSASLSVQVNF